VVTANRTGQNADKQRAVYLLGDKCQHNGDDGRCQSHNRAVVIAVRRLLTHAAACTCFANSRICHAGAIAFAALQIVLPWQYQRQHNKCDQQSSNSNEFAEIVLFQIE
jgi:hypothetical protein